MMKDLSVGGIVPEWQVEPSKYPEKNRMLKAESDQPVLAYILRDEL